MPKPVPPNPVITDHELYHDGEFQGICKLASIPCPNKTVGEKVVELVERKFTVALAEHTMGDNGHAAFAVKTTSDAKNVIDYAQSARDRIRQQKGLGEYDGGGTTDERTSHSSNSNSDSKSDSPRYIH